MADPLTKAIKVLNLIHSTIHQNVLKFPSYVSDPKMFPKIASVMMIGSGLLGLGLMQIVNSKREDNFQIYYEEQKRKPMSQDELLVRAMIENAKSSTMKENLENAAMAQKNFMLIPFDQSVANDKKDQTFIQKIVKRSDEIKEANATDEEKRL